MRKIIFRGKRMHTGEWIKGGLFFVKGCTNPFIKPSDNKEGPFEVDPETVGQYIGLIDAKGNPIFEGDIVRSIRHAGLRPDKDTRLNALVQYGAMNCTCCNGVYGWEFSNGDIRASIAYVVIGNKHDNPELFDFDEWRVLR